MQKAFSMSRHNIKYVFFQIMEHRQNKSVMQNRKVRKGNVPYCIPEFKLNADKYVSVEIIRFNFLNCINNPGITAFNYLTHRIYN